MFWILRGFAAQDDVEGRGLSRHVRVIFLRVCDIPASCRLRIFRSRACPL